MEPISQRHADLVVAGGGPAGVCAAIAAARQGADVVLVERYGFLGGMATIGYIYPFMNFYAGDNALVAGIWGEMIERMRLSPYGAKRTWVGDFDVEELKMIWLDMCREAGVTLHLHTLITDAQVDGHRVVGVVTHSKSGREDLQARLVIDCTGDGDVAARAGASYEIGRPEDGLMQPMTLHFRMAQVDFSRMPPYEEIDAGYRQAQADGRISDPRENILVFRTGYPDQLHFNSTRVLRRDGTNRDDLTCAELEARQQTQELVAWLTQTVPGFAQAYLLATGPQIGIRESRRIVGEYLLTADDLLSCTRFPDAIALSNYPIDIHNPAGTGTVLHHLQPGEYYSIPYRSLVPAQIDGLLVAGRPISATHEAHAATRIMPTCGALGEAAGTAAVLALNDKIDARKVDPQVLRQRLAGQGAVVV